MARVVVNAPCPCGSTRKTKRCCAPFLAGEPAPTPEALMRSRYTAYAVGDVRHLMRTTHPQSPHAQRDARQWADALAAYCAAVRFVGLTVHAASATEDQGMVAFTALLRRKDGDAVLTLAERSRFVRVEGRWLYLDGQPLEHP